jgi:hypothetical protein
LLSKINYSKLILLTVTELAMNTRMGFGTNLNQAQAVQPFTFHDCVRKIKEIYEVINFFLFFLIKRLSMNFEGRNCFGQHV